MPSCVSCTRSSEFLRSTVLKDSVKDRVLTDENVLDIVCS